MEPRQDPAQDLSDFVKKYANSSFLLKPEEIVLEQLRSQLPSMKMLDLGVGGGRTTFYFGGLAEEYVGVDFDKNMIEACQRRFPESSNLRFINCNARSMGLFESGYFDFILFSFNGIDYLSHGERMQALAEIKRVGRRGGLFLFSTHNLNAIDSPFAPRSFSVAKAFKNPLGIPGSLWRRFVIWLRNRNLTRVKDQQYVMIFDGEYASKLKWVVLSIIKNLGYYYYSRPQEQVRQLKETGFEIIRTYSVEGQEIIESELNTTDDYWLHYLCRIS